MILYNLKCPQNHSFEVWFKDSGTYDKQAKRKQIECPICSDTAIEKAIMAPNVLMKGQNETKEKKLASSPSNNAITELKTHIEKNSEDVGNNFALLARKMHIGDLPERTIHGKASLSEAKSLSEDGVPIVPLPWFNRKIN